jgi:bifunctional DNA-binding transcriptional regulator/antitoxin component of YhaV-PrlF toxin-antitoxin module
LSNKVRIQQFPQGQYMITIPRALAQALDIEKGDRAEWKIRDGDLVLRLL